MNILLPKVKKKNENKRGRGVAMITNRTWCRQNEI
jgi:hypothetical protein